MTEKRFIIDEYFEIGSVIIDTENENIRFKHENKLSMKQCCDVLNEQHERIQELERDIETICNDYEKSHGMDIRNAEWFTAW